jgi:isochorismate hydrolase
LGKTIAELNIDHALGNFSKTRFSMCISEVQEKLNSLPNIDSIVLFGLEAHICIEQTSLDFLATEKYNVHIVADCVLSRSLEDRLFALERMKNCGCFITTSENVIFKLLRDANHENFNAVRKLVTEPSAYTGLCNKL